MDRVNSSGIARWFGIGCYLDAGSNRVTLIARLPIGCMLAATGLLLQVSALCAPRLFAQPQLQSPVSVEPGDPLLLPGGGLLPSDVVVYQTVQDDGETLSRPKVVPTSNNQFMGTASVVESKSAPDALVVQWPRVTEPGRPYAIWVKDHHGGWSNATRVNDARPMWFSPTFAYRSGQIGHLPRYIKVVGRNLKPYSGASRRIKLVSLDRSGDEVELTVDDSAAAAQPLKDFVASARLPAVVLPGRYQVAFSRDGENWVSVADQTFSVLPDREQPRVLPISTYGCQPDDGRDDGPCIRKAVAEAAARKGRTVVSLGTGVWDLVMSGDRGSASGKIVLPQGVDFVGLGADRTTLAHSALGGTRGKKRLAAWIVLGGHNVVSGIRFKDDDVHRGSRPTGAVLQVGRRLRGARAQTAGLVSTIVIENSHFDKPFTAIVDGGQPLERVFILGNEFGAYENALFLNGLSTGGPDKFRIDDSVIADNVFEPGSFMDIKARRGPIASQLGASRRLDFSRNRARGESKKYLYDPRNDSRGWRAGYFWHLRNNHEMLLIAQNQATCTGDKTGDGEAIAFDNNHNTYGFREPQKVLEAGADTVSVSGALMDRHEGNPLADDFFEGHWMQVVDGPGMGQARKVVSYEYRSGHLTLRVAPGWDVVPEPGSRIAAGLQFWQVFVLDNEVDNREPLCQKSNRRKTLSSPYGAGAIALWAQAADSVIAGNRQFDTDGIKLHPFFSVPSGKCPKCRTSYFLQYFIDVSDNTVDGEYQWESDCSWSGIGVYYGAAPSPYPLPPVIGYGIRVSGNTVRDADGVRGGAISVVPTWWDGPKSISKQPLIRNSLIYRNVINLSGAETVDTSCRSGSRRRKGILLGSRSVVDTVLESNVFSAETPIHLEDKAVGTTVMH